MLNVSNLTVFSGLDYQLIPNLQLQQQVYIDRTFVIKDIPMELVGAVYIQTANNDKAQTGSNFMSFEVDQSTKVYVGHDLRIAQKPQWLGLFVDTGKDIVSNEGTADQLLHLYSKVFPPGRIILGANSLTASGSMYVVALLPSTVTPVEPPIEPLPDTDWTIVANRPGVIALEQRFDPKDPNAILRFIADIRRVKPDVV